MLNIFVYVYLPVLCVFFSELSVQIFCPLFIELFDFLLSCENYMYVIHTSPLSYFWFANMFSQSVVCLLNLLKWTLGSRSLWFWYRKNNFRFHFVIYNVFWVIFLYVVLSVFCIYSIISTSFFEKTTFIYKVILMSFVIIMCLFVAFLVFLTLGIYWAA